MQPWLSLSLVFNSSPLRSLEPSRSLQERLQLQQEPQPLLIRLHASALHCKHSRHLQVLALAACAHLLLKAPQRNEAHESPIACIQGPATKTATSEGPWCNKRQQGKMLNRRTSLALTPLPLRFCPCKGQGQITCWQNPKRTRGAKELPHGTTLKGLSLPFLAATVTRRKKRKRTRYICILYTGSLPYRIFSPLRAPATLGAAS